jgi:rod shape-determining protein MreC
MIDEAPRRRLPRWATTMLVLLVAIGLVAPTPLRNLEQVGSTMLAPVQMGLSGTADEVSGVTDTLQRVRSMADQNQQYRDQIDRLQSQLAQMKELEAENQDLRNLLDLKQRTGPGTLLPTTVIARDDTPYVEAVTIDIGGHDGVQSGDAVVTDRGLVGRVEVVNPTSSKVRLISDLNSSVSVRLQTADRTTGILRGQSQGNLLAIAYIPQTDTVTAGDVVVTSGLGEVFPEGLVVGTVSTVQRNDADPFQVAVVQSAVDMNKLERMYVLAEHPQS